MRGREFFLKGIPAHISKPPKKTAVMRQIDYDKFSFNHGLARLRIKDIISGDSGIMRQIQSERIRNFREGLFNEPASAELLSASKRAMDTINGILDDLDRQERELWKKYNAPTI